MSKRAELRLGSLVKSFWKFHTYMRSFVMKRRSSSLLNLHQNENKSHPKSGFDLTLLLEFLFTGKTDTVFCSRDFNSIKSINLVLKDGWFFFFLPFFTTLLLNERYYCHVFVLDLCLNMSKFPTRPFQPGRRQWWWREIVSLDLVIINIGFIVLL